MSGEQKLRVGMIGPGWKRTGRRQVGGVRTLLPNRRGLFPERAGTLVLMGHDGPGHALIAQDKIRVRRLEGHHGKVGSGLSVEMAVKHGPVTLLSVVEHKEYGIQLLVAEGESVHRPVLEIGNTNSCYRFSIGARSFMER